MVSNPKDDLSTTTIFQWEGGIDYLPRRVYIYLSNRSIKEKNGRSFPIPRLGCDVMDKTNSNDPYAHKGRFRIISGTGALQTYEIEGIIDLTA